MLKFTLAFFVASLLSGVLGFSGRTSATGRIGRVLFFVTMAMFVGSIALVLTGGSFVL